MIRNSFRILGQIIIWCIISLLGRNLIYMKIPGNGAICDAEQIFLVTNLGLFFLFSFLLSINTVIFYKKQHWTFYRKLSLFFVIALFFCVFTIRPIIILVSFGQESILIENKDDDWLYVDLKLYENGTFFSDIYDLSCEEEIIGNYTITNEIIELKYKQESKYLGTKLQIVDSEIISLDSDMILKIKIPIYP